jgi:hypothetical protein
MSGQPASEPPQRCRVRGSGWRARDSPQCGRRENGYCDPICSDTAAHRNGLAGLDTGIRRQRDQFEHGGMQRVGAARQRRVAAVHRERVLRQVIAADRQEINLPQQDRCIERSGRSLDHGAEFDPASVAEFGVEFFDQGAHRPDFGNVRNHRYEQLHDAKGLHPQGCAQLRPQQVRTSQRGANSAKTERRILFVRQR